MWETHGSFDIRCGAWRSGRGMERCGGRARQESSATLRSFPREPWRPQLGDVMLKAFKQKDPSGSLLQYGPF